MWYRVFAVATGLFLLLVVGGAWWWGSAAGPSQEVLDEMQAALEEHEKTIGKQRYAILVDYHRPIFCTRLWVIDRQSGDIVLSSRVSHARNSGFLIPTSFSNTPQSYLSCKGSFVTAEAYQGRYGRGMRIKGLEPGVNDNAYVRNIVFHPKCYIWSGGCFMTEEEVNDRIIELTAAGCFLYVVGNEATSADGCGSLS